MCFTHHLLAITTSSVSCPIHANNEARKCSTSSILNLAPQPVWAFACLPMENSVTLQMPCSLTVCTMSCSHCTFQTLVSFLVQANECPLSSAPVATDATDEDPRISWHAEWHWCREEAGASWHCAQSKEPIPKSSSSLRLLLTSRPLGRVASLLLRGSSLPGSSVGSQAQSNYEFGCWMLAMASTDGLTCFLRFIYCKIGSFTRQPWFLLLLGTRISRKQVSVRLWAHTCG